VELSEWMSRRPRLTFFIVAASLAGAAAGAAVGFSQPVLSTASARVLIVTATGRELNSFEVQPVISELVLTMDLPSTFETVSRETGIPVATLRGNTRVVRDPADPYIQIEIDAKDAQSAQFSATKYATVSLEAMAENSLKRSQGQQARIRDAISTSQNRLVELAEEAGVSDITTYLEALGVESQTLALAEASAPTEAERSEASSRLASLNRKIRELAGTRTEAALLDQQIQSQLPILANASTAAAQAEQQLALAREGAGVVLYNVSSGSKITKAIQSGIAGLLLTGSALFAAALLVVEPLERRRKK
jgi:hypothetical protein